MAMVLADPDPEWLAERERLGIDRMDEVWDGVLHVPPRPTSFHQRFQFQLHLALLPIVQAHALEIFHELSIYDPGKGANNYRTPDLVIAAPADISRRGIEGHAELVVEVLSAHDESREKFDFYAACGIAEYWLVDPETRDIELYVLRGTTYFAVMPNRNGVIQAPRLGLELSVVEGPKLRVAWADGSADV